MRNPTATTPPWSIGTLRREGFSLWLLCTQVDCRTSKDATAQHKKKRREKYNRVRLECHTARLILHHLARNCDWDSYSRATKHPMGTPLSLSSILASWPSPSSKSQHEHVRKNNNNPSARLLARSLTTQLAPLYTPPPFYHNTDKHTETKCHARRDCPARALHSPVALHIQPLQPDQGGNATDLGDLIFAQPKLFKRRAPFQPRNRPASHEAMKQEPTERRVRHKKLRTERTPCTLLFL